MPRRAGMVIVSLVGMMFLRAAPHVGARQGSL
jgi:hypothetical protein